MSRVGRSPSRSGIWKRVGTSQLSLKIQEGEGESLQVAKSMQPEIHSLEGKSPYISRLPLKFPESQKIRFFGKTPFVPEIAATPAKRVKFPAHLTYKGKTCPNAHLAAFNNEMDMDSHTDPSWCKNFILTLELHRNGRKVSQMDQFQVLMSWQRNSEVTFHQELPEQSNPSK